jgi:hypothetical protein
MGTSFRLVALSADPFAPLFSQSDGQLRAAGARRVVVDEKPGYPCRVSLVDAEVGETVLLVSFAHHEVDSPYRASGPIVVRRGAATATPEIDSVPPMLRHRLLSVRAYDGAAMSAGSEVVKGVDLEPCLRRMLADDGVRYLHIHNAGPGCFNCAVVRA